MMTYILLRNNKESGPFGLDEIRKAGLRAQDLVWVEGQSVCWLNPAQIKELRDYVGEVVPKEVIVAPAADKVNPVQADKKPEPAVVAEPKPIVQEEHQRFMPQKEVFSSDPDEVPTYRVDEDTEIVFPNKHGVYKVKEKEAVPETKYSKPLEEIKALYVKSLEQRMKQRRFQLHIPPQVKKAAVYAGILAVGLLIGILLNKGNQKDAIAQQVPDQIQKTESENLSLQEGSLPVQDSVVMVNPLPAETVSDDRSYAENETARSTERIAAKKQVAPDSGTAKADNDEQLSLENEVRSEPDAKPQKELSLQEIRKMISVSTNDYNVGSFGGIKNLELTVSNSSKFNLDHVVVELKYLKPRDEFLKSENISFYSIGPNDSKTVHVPKSTRGVKVSYRIIRVESKEVSSTTAGL